MNENELSQKIKSAFAEAVPSEELTERLLKADRPKRIRRFSALKIAAAAFAAFIMVGAGVYTVSEISYDDVFGNYVKVADKELGDSLIGTVTGFKYKVSDNDYAIRILGAAGDSHNIMLKAEIYRKDGEPVKKHFRNISEDENDRIDCPFLNCEIASANGGGGSGGLDFNEAGNIQFYCNYNYDSNISGKRFTAEGSDLYSNDLFWNFCNENEVFYNHTAKEKYFTDRNTLDRKDISDESIIGLRLDWKFSLRFVPSESSDAKKIYADVPAEISLNNVTSFIKWDEKNHGSITGELTQTPTCKLTAMEFTAVGGKLKYEWNDDFDYGSYIAENYPLMNVTPDDSFRSPKNEMYLIKKDGSKIKVEIGGESRSSEGGSCLKKITAELEYKEPTGRSNALGEIYERVYIDISDVKSFYVNGVIFELE